VGDDLGLKAHNGDRPDSVQDAAPRWPELHLLKQVEEINTLTVIPFLRFHSSSQTITRLQVDHQVMGRDMCGSKRFFESDRSLRTALPKPSAGYPERS